MSLIKNKKGGAAVGTIIGLIVVAAIAVGVYFMFFAQNQVSVEGLTGAQQKQVKTGSASLDVTGYEVNITYKYEYTIDGLVVGTKNYTSSSDIKAQISNKDVVLAWGTVAENNAESEFNWKLADRDYTFTATSSIDENTIIKNSSITHLIASDTTTENQIKKIKTGQHVILTGYLVDVTAEPSVGDKVEWNTSTRRDDTGADAGEILYVTGVETVDIPES